MMNSTCLQANGGHRKSYGDFGRRVTFLLPASCYHGDATRRPASTRGRRSIDICPTGALCVISFFAILRLLSQQNKLPPLHKTAAKFNRPLKRVLAIFMGRPSAIDGGGSRFSFPILMLQMAFTDVKTSFRGRTLTNCYTTVLTWPIIIGQHRSAVDRLQETCANDEWFLPLEHQLVSIRWECTTHLVRNRFL